MGYILSRGIPLLFGEYMKYAYVTQRRQAPIGYVTVTKPLARLLYDQGKAVTLCGNNVNSYHVFNGWRLGHSILKESCQDHYAWQSDFDHICRSFLSYLDSELGSYIVFYTKKENV